MAFPRRLARIAILLGLTGGDGSVPVDEELRAPAVRPGIAVLLPDAPDRGHGMSVAALAAEAPSRIVDAFGPAGRALEGTSAADENDARDADLFDEDGPGASAQPNAADLSLVELRAAAMLVSRGTVERVTLSGFRVWPGLMAESTEISRAQGVRIVPAVTRTGGQVDFIVTRDEAGPE